MDRRQWKTRDAIFEAFSSLLSKKSLSQITVQDIIDRANIGRTTFYAHFATKDELLKALCVDMFTHVFSDSLSKENTHDFSQECSNPRAMIAHILYHLLENKRNIIGILTFESGGLFYGFFNQFFREWTSRQLIHGRTWKAKDLPEDFLIHHISSSFVGLVQWWLANGMTHTPEQLSGYFMAVIDPMLTPEPSDACPLSRSKE